MAWIYEDQLPGDMSDEDYAEWFAQSKVVYGVRMGPPFPFCKDEADDDDAAPAPSGSERGE